MNRFMSSSSVVNVREALLPPHNETDSTPARVVADGTLRKYLLITLNHAARPSIKVIAPKQIHLR